MKQKRKETTRIGTVDYLLSKLDSLFWYASCTSFHFILPILSTSPGAVVLIYTLFLCKKSALRYAGNLFFVTAIE